MSNILYVDGNVVPKVDDSKLYFLNRLTILYGTSGTGKSSLITHILNTVKDYVPVAIVCNPTNAMNGDYTNVFPDSAIHDDVTKNLLINIFERQTNMISMYKMVRDINMLKEIFVLIATPDELQRMRNLDNILNKGTSYAQDNCKDEDYVAMVDELTETYNRKALRTMRSAINKNIDRLFSKYDSLTDTQKSILSNFNINPNILLLIDDCAASIKEWRDLTETRKLFFQGRHYKVTVLLTMQTESVITPYLRQNAHISIFTTKNIVSTYVNKQTSGYTTEDKNKIIKIAAAIFAQTDPNAKPNYKKLIIFSSIIHTEHKIQYMTAIPKKKKFGCEPFWELCNQLKKDNLVTTNSAKFNKMFNMKSLPSLNI